MEAVVVGSVLSVALKVLLNHIAPNQEFIRSLFSSNNKFFKCCSIKLNKLEEALDRLKEALVAISVVVEDAEDKRERSPPVEVWFNSLKHAVHQAENLLDEINTKRLRKVQHSKGKLSGQFIGELYPRLQKICAELERKVQLIGVLGLQSLNGRQKREDKAPSTSVVIQSQILGRKAEKEKIIQMLLSAEGTTDNVSVIPITGMGGVGKTTLAQLVYDDEKVKNHFETRAWVCVSEEFDVIRVTKDILREINSSLVDENDGLNRLQVKLKENLEAKRFIIILDDFWNDNYNDQLSLMTPLKSGGSRGSKIIVTTRSENIALKLQDEPFHHLQPISEDQSWSLFKLHAFVNGVHTDEFETVGRPIAEMCKGLPLAIKTVAGALRSKHHIREWQNILSSDDWMVKGDILPALSLSYKLLPSHLKDCFAFCAVFPKDVPFAKEEVVLLWMANDLVRPLRLFDAQIYFDELRSLSFFEMGNDNKYVMHDLINDLARHVSGSFCARMEDCQFKDVHRGIQVKYDLPPEVLHCSYLNSDVDDDKLERLRGLAQARGLRTFLFNAPFTYGYDLGGITKIFFTDILPKLRHIRALSLHIYIKVIPNSIGDLKHLRLLNLADINIKKLPNNITKCLNLQTLILAGCSKLEELPKDTRLLIYLQTLILEGCSELKELPKDMVLLTNLQTLILADCRNLEELPEDMGLLTNLQHLDVRGVGNKLIAKIKIWLIKLKDIQNLTIAVNHIHGSALEQLDKLQLSQFLKISELGNGVTVEMARNAELKNKNYIEKLTLNWSSSSEDELKILAELRPHTNIRELRINGYRGTGFPNWVGDSSFCNLQELTLYGCENCIHLPPLGQLTGLKKLTILRCDGLESLTPEGGLPPSLESLEIGFCKFPRNWGLQRLPSLIKLSIGGIEDKLIPEEGLLPATLKVLDIWYCPNLEALNPKGFQGITSLQKLIIKWCPELRCFPEDGLPSSLSELRISRCPKLEGRLEREKGEDWPKISHIPIINVDYKRI